MTQPRIEPVALSLEKRLHQEFLCQFGTMDAVIGFARENMGAADLALSALQARVLTVGEGEDAYRFAREVHGADRAACQAQAAEQDRILHEGAAIDAYSFAKSMPGADRKALEARVLSVGSATDIFLFARDVPGTDVGACQMRVQALCKSSCRVLYWFAKNIKNANIFTLHEQASEMGFAGLDKDQRADFKTLLALWAAEVEMANKLFEKDRPATDFHSPN